MQRETTLLYVHGESIGYGRLGVRLAEQFAAKGVDVYDGIEPPPDIKGQLTSGDRKVNEGRRAKRTNSIGWVSVPTHARGWYEGQVPWIFTMWEADWLPEAFRETLHHFDTVIVPSPQNVDLFSTYHPNVHLATLGVDPEVWHYQQRQAPTDTFDVLIGGSGGRKGVDVALKAFRLAFPPGSWGDGPTPRLVLKSPRSDLGFPDPLEKAALDFPPDDQLLIINGRLDAADEVALYARSHVYLQPSRGEGFGLQPLQAIAQGMPTILTDAHGHESFAHLGYGVDYTMERAGYFIYGGHPDMRWWEPKVDEIVDHLRDIYANYDNACAFAAESSRNALDYFTWSDCADQVLEVVGPDMEVPYSGSGEWIAPSVQRFLVRVNRHYSADIAGVSFQFEPGRDYYEHADVKRILYEAEVLDPSCLERVRQTTDGEQFDDHGLTQAQAERIDQYTAAHSFCPECRQPLNEAPTRADMLWALSEAARGEDIDRLMAELMSSAAPPRMEPVMDYKAIANGEKPVSVTSVSAA